MKILMLTNFYPPIIGGMGHHVQSVSRELVKRGHEVIVCTTAQRALPMRGTDNGVTVLRLKGLFQQMPFLFKDPGQRHHPPARDPAISRSLKRIIDEQKPNVINAHGWMLFSLLPWVKRYDIPLVLSLMDCEFICPKQSLVCDGDSLCDHPFTPRCITCGKTTYGLAKSIATYCGIRDSRRKLKLVDRFIAISTSTKRVNVTYLGLNDEDVEVIPCFYDPDTEGKIIDPESNPELPDDFILFVGALSPHKGTEVLLRAYRKLNTQTKLVLIGSRHPDYHYVTGDSVVVLENAPRDVVMSAMSRCRFAVFPSIWAEGFGIVAIEAMSHSKAVIASDIGGLKDIVVDGDTGFLVAPGDAEKLAASMEQLLKDPRKAVEMGLRGHERFTENFTPDAVMPRITDLYERLIHEHANV